MTLRSALVVLVVGWATVLACIAIAQQIEPRPPYAAPASGSLAPTEVEPDAIPAATAVQPPQSVPIPPGDDWAATALSAAERGERVAVGLPPVPAPIDGACESWRPLLERYGIPYVEALPVMRRESNCTMAHNGNARTRDDSWGPFQVNRYGSLAAWWDEGGYTAEVMATPEGSVAAAAVLYHSCRWAPWRPPYGCDGDYLATPTPTYPGGNP